MTRAAIPAEDVMLCERCGYVLAGLPGGSNCPECGTSISESDPALRHLSAWEDPADDRPEIVRFAATSAEVIFMPRRFYRGLATRHGGHQAFLFAVVHWAISALLLSAAINRHLRWSGEFGRFTDHSDFFVMAILFIGVFIVLESSTALAGRLTYWEASYRGLRMPLTVVLRSMYYHAAHYLPVCAAVFATVAIYQHYLWRGTGSPVTYLYVLCIEVLLAAVYLFKTYWTGMKNVMYANR